MTTYLGKSCSFCLPRVPFVNCRQFMYLVISLLVLRAGYGIWLYQFLIIAYLFTLEWKFVQMFRVTWPRWLPGSYMVKIWKKNLLRNQEADDLETWYTALGTQVLSNSSNEDTGLTLPIFMTWSNLFRDASVWVKAYIANSHIFRRLF